MGKDKGRKPITKKKKYCFCSAPLREDGTCSDPFCKPEYAKPGRRRIMTDAKIREKEKEASRVVQISKKELEEGIAKAADKLKVPVTFLAPTNSIFGNDDVP